MAIDEARDGELSATVDWLVVALILQVAIHIRDLALNDQDVLARQQLAGLDN